MKLADRRWRYLAVIPLVIGVAVILIGSFSVESGGTNTVLGLPAPGLGGALVGLGIGVIMVSRRAEKDPPSN